MARKITDRTAFAGESLTGTFTAPDGATAVSLKLADGVNTATVEAVANHDGTWVAAIDAAALSGFSGSTRWIAYATTADGTEAIASGSIYIRALVSKYRAVVAAIESALQTYGSNPNQSISVGEISITYKDYEDLMSLLAYWRRRAEADENGTEPTGSVRTLKVRFA